MRATAVGLLCCCGVLAGCATAQEVEGPQQHLREGRLDEAIQAGQQSLQSQPDDGETHYSIALACMMKDRGLDPEAASYADSSTKFVTMAGRHFSRAAALAPPDHALGHGYTRSQVKQEQRTLFRVHYNRGVIAAKNRQSETAALEYGLAALAEPSEHRGYYARAGANWNLAREAADRGELERFIELSDAVVRDLEQVLSLEPDDAHVRVAAYRAKGDVLHRRGETLEAHAVYEQALEIEPDNELLLRTLAERAYNEGLWDLAVESFERFLETKERLIHIRPDDASHFAAWGNALLELGRRDEAIAAFERALELDPSHPMSLRRLRSLR